MERLPQVEEALGEGLRTTWACFRVEERGAAATQYSGLQMVGILASVPAESVIAMTPPWTP